jgi:hypothetical protein
MKFLLALLAALTLAVVTIGNAAAAAPPPAEFQDPSGDSGPGPDITKVSVSSDEAGTITFRVETPNRPTVSANLIVVVYIDSDNNPIRARVTQRRRGRTMRSARLEAP